MNKYDVYDVKAQKAAEKAAKLGMHYGSNMTYVNSVFSKMEHRIDAQIYSSSTVTMNNAKESGMSKQHYKTLSENLTEDLNRLEELVKQLKQSKDLVLELEKTFNRGDVVFHKERGPGILKRFIIYGDHSSSPEFLFTLEEAKHGDILAQFVNAGGEFYCLAKDLVPYTESVKLFYENERNNTNK